MIRYDNRFGFYKLVTSQRVDEFLDCHIKAFEYFGDIPRTVKLDNLKSGEQRVRPTNYMFDCSVISLKFCG